LAEINGWDYVPKSFYLAGSLKRGAIALLNEPVQYDSDYY
jgi:hypothetical protein